MRVLIPFLLLILTVSAQAESYSTGPFDITLNMGFPIKFNIEEPVESETLSGEPFTEYRLTNGSPKDIKYIGLSIFEDHTNMPADLSVDMLKLYEGVLYQRIMSDRVIDGHAGKIISGYVLDTTVKAHIAIWVIDGRTDAILISTYPWDEGTRQLLNSINITRH